MKSLTSLCSSHTDLAWWVCSPDELGRSYFHCCYCCWWWCWCSVGNSTTMQRDRCRRLQRAAPVMKDIDTATAPALEQPFGHQLHGAPVRTRRPAVLVLASACKLIINKLNSLQFIIIIFTCISDKMMGGYVGHLLCTRVRIYRVQCTYTRIQVLQ